MKLKFKETPLLNNNSIAEAFGLTEERGNELVSSCQESFKEDPFLITSLPRMLQECNTIEEYSYACLVIGGWIEHSRQPVKEKI